MPPPPEGYSWKSLESAPPDEDITLNQTVVAKRTFRKRLPAGWVSSSKGTPLAVTPVAWSDISAARPPPR